MCDKWGRKFLKLIEEGGSHEDGRIPISPTETVLTEVNDVHNFIFLLMARSIRGRP